ncbi:hypothetical protein ACJMK2_009439 [Sinanodonta woodiana]|uniref:G-protein coupled receptors family 1 profile domain-containing protein n=1 Tax=Sinanodonta woodiana TaxID=1069815 RepID=A0ABD3VFC2_SINWO
MNHHELYTHFENSTLFPFLSTGHVKENSTTNSIDDLLNSIGPWLWKTVSIVLLVFGLAGNLLTVLVFRKIGVSKRPTLFFLFILAITDSVVLLTGLLRYWILHAFQFDIRTLSDIGCKINIFLLYSSMQYSSWILVFVCIERIIKTYFPLHFIRIVTFRRVSLSLIILFVVLVGINVQFLWTYGINTFTGGKCDSITPEIYAFHDYVFANIDFAVLSAAPLLIMSVCNVFLFIALTRIKRERAQMMHDIVFRRTQHVGVKLTKMLLVCTVYFLIATVPVSVYFVVYPYYKKIFDTENDPHGVIRMEVARAPTYLMQYSNYSVNFYLYSLTNSKFWRNLREVVCGCHKGIKHQRNSVFTLKPQTPTPSAAVSARNVETEFSSGFETRASSSQIYSVIE